MAINVTSFPEETSDRHPTCNITTCKYFACLSKLKLLLCVYVCMLYIISQPVDAMQVTTQLPFCDETAVHEQYILETPPPCVKPKSLMTLKCHAKIYNPS